MLSSLTIRDFVLIDQLTLEFEPGLCVLTGETGAGKSILLDALGLALGARADSALVRPGGANGQTQARVTAEFSVGADHPALGMMREQGLDVPDDGDPLVLRRTLAADGRSRAHVNDQPVAVSLLREIGDTLVEIEGQFASQGLLDQKTHRAALDAFGCLSGLRQTVAAKYRTWREAATALDAARAKFEAIRKEEDYLRHVAAELEALAPAPGEEDELAESRANLMHAERITETIRSALESISGDAGAEDRLGDAHRVLVRNAEKAGARLDGAIEALERAQSETADAAAHLERTARELTAGPRNLEQIEERLFALRAAARKHHTDVASLPALLERFRTELAEIDGSDQRIGAMEAALVQSRDAYETAARQLGDKRRKAARGLDKAVTAELAPLRLEKAVFKTVVDEAPESRWGADGVDEVEFLVATNPGIPPGPMARIASGGELARFMLALKLSLSAGDADQTLVFDEVDAGIGGATAAAVGDRLHRLAEGRQVLVVTHSPQVAARGVHHLRVVKNAAGRSAGDGTVTRVEMLSGPARQEEIARMLAGAKITDEARAAAASLIEGRS